MTHFKKLPIDENIKITHTRKTYIRTESGKSWSQAKDNIHTETETIDAKSYNRWMDSIEAFSSGYSTSYEFYGNMVTEIVSIEPFAGNTKNIDTFEFD